MSIFTESQAVVVIGDYIGVDAGGKLNVLGLGFAITGITQAGTTPPMSVAVIVDVPARYAGNEFALSIEFRDESGRPVRVPAGPGGSLEPLRVQQLVKAEHPSVPGVYLPDRLPCRVQLNLGFPTGLPVTGGQSYTWRLEIEGQHRPNWQASFYVVGAPPGPVFGGPAGRADPGDLPSLDA